MVICWVEIVYLTLNCSKLEAFRSKMLQIYFLSSDYILRKEKALVCVNIYENRLLFII